MNSKSEEDCVSLTSDFIVDKFNNRNFHVPRFGSIDEIIFSEFFQQTKKELARPFFNLVETKSLSFCGPTPPMVYPSSKDEARKLWSEEYTVSLQHLNLRNNFFFRVCDNVSNSLGHEITASLYLSKPNSQAFSWHTDEWDNLCIQVIGEKKFHFKSEGSDSWSREFSPSEWLRINSDEVHKASSTVMSAHLSFARHLKHKR